MRTWFINDYAVLYLLHVNGFHCERQSFIGGGWYVTDLPIDGDERYELPEGFVIEAHSGIELRAAKKEQGKP